MRLAYADPPYLGLGSYYDAHHPDSRTWDLRSTHLALIERLASDYPDGWAVSMTSGNLHDLLPLMPREARIAAWVKPFASFKPGVSPAYTWEPVVFVRTRKHTKEEATVRDHLAANITMQRGLTGAKPEAFCSWVLDLLGWQQGDTLDDLFPGTGVMGRVVRARSEVDEPDALPLFDLTTEATA